jgi:hypothetical protein
MMLVRPTQPNRRGAAARDRQRRAEGDRPGDNVQAIEAWAYPQPFDGVTVADMDWFRDQSRNHSYRAAPRAADWGGYILADRLGLNIGVHGCPRRPVGQCPQADSHHHQGLVANRALATVKRRDERARKDFDYLAPGSWEENPD